MMQAGYAIAMRVQCIYVGHNRGTLVAKDGLKLVHSITNLWAKSFSCTLVANWVAT